MLISDNSLFWSSSKKIFFWL